MRLTDAGELQSYEEVMTSNEKKEWAKAIKDEMQSLHKNHTYDLVELPNGRQSLKNKWVYRLKIIDNSLSPRYMARIVIKGCNQKKGIDFEDIFSLVVKMSSIKIVLDLAACLDFEVEHLIVKTTFLHGGL